MLEIQRAAVEASVPEQGYASLGNLYRSIKIADESESFCTRLRAFMGPGALVAVRRAKELDIYHRSSSADILGQ